MIGPTSTFYDGGALAHGKVDSQTQYQQWIETSYREHHQQQSMHQHPTHQRGDVYQPSQQQQTYQQAPQQLTHVFNQHSYPQANVSYAQAHYAESLTGAATQSNVGGTHRTTHPNSADSYHQSQSTANSYAAYSAQTTPETGAHTPDPNTGHTVSYSTTPDPPYHQQPTQRAPSVQRQIHGQGLHHSRSHSQPQPRIHYVSPQGATSHASELMSISSHSNPHSSTDSSSLSPTSNSWTDEVYSSANSNANIKTHSNRMHVPCIEYQYHRNIGYFSNVEERETSKPRSAASYEFNGCDN
ncbi:hypothetical protein DXG03_009281 [Asterophora parasitica]|uniref:Uncharacterized protein n=1 Tax=Asterophora parasitica TaxID=117018 RepID=A0A9P7K9Y8_9AGAR|nr:hypothetical protein DXG03_009281 [Asterophora parasitica]